ncbi:MAG TPA: EAL domain-containing protein [Longimicrobium sp.]
MTITSAEGPLRPELLELLFAAAPVGIVLLAPDGSCAATNDHACTLLGSTRQALLGRPCSADGHVVAASDGWRWLVLQDGTALDRMAVRLRDAEVRAAALEASEEKFALLSEATFEGVLVHENGIVLQASTRLAEMFGYTAAELTGMDGLLLTVPEDRPRLRGHIQSDSEAPLRGTGLRKDGSTFPGELRGRSFVFRGRTLRVAAFRDVTDQTRLESELLQRALHDPLTGLPNRVLALERIGAAVERDRREPGFFFAVLLLDLDRFKVINDSLGHRAGDAVLTAAAHRLASCVGEGTLAARFGGDEFIVLVEGTGGIDDAVAAARRIEAAFEQPMFVDGRELYVTPGIGIAPGGSGAPDDLLRIADAALYRAKAGGGAQFEVYDQSMHLRAMARLQLECELRRALENEALRVAYQPIVALQTGNVVGFEALARWQDPVRGHIPPSEFIPVAEDTGLIVSLDRWVLRESCRRMSELRARQPGGRLLLSVNLSGKHFNRPDLVPCVDAVLAETGMDGGGLRLEITESVLVEPSGSVLRIFEELRARGIQFAIDDFGTGYSSLGYLHRLPVQSLKIDRSFMRGRAGDGEIIRAVITLGHGLGMEVVAEGVETRAVRDQLRSLGCEFAQGYLFAPALDGTELDDLVAGGRNG